LAREKQQKRSRFETMNAILHLCMQTTKKTHVMYKVNLSHQQLKKYLSALTEAGLLEPVEGGYLTTQRGRLFVEKFRELSSVVETETGGASIVGTILVRNR